MASALWAVLLMVAGGALAWLAHEVLQDRRPPVVVHDAQFVESAAKPGARVRLRVDRTRVRSCPGQASMVWRSGSTNIQAGTSNTIADVTFRSDRATIDLVKTIPNAATPGRWCYVATLTYKCPDADHFVQQAPACLEVIK